MNIKKIKNLIGEYEDFKSFKELYNTPDARLVIQTPTKSYSLQPENTILIRKDVRLAIGRELDIIEDELEKEATKGN
jgi:hypothetical protein